MIRNYAISTLKPCQNRKVAAIRDACDRRSLRVILYLWGCNSSVFSTALCLPLVLNTPQIKINLAADVLESTYLRV
jgi:hypothetical protein